ncbi:hypothetical protein AALI21_02755 [Corynebacteriaceae bacterium 6-324]
MNWDQDDTFLDKWSVGEDWARVALSAGNRAKDLWDSIVARETGELASSAFVTLALHKGTHHTALYAVVGANAPHAMAHEFGNAQVPAGREWQQVLSMLKG